MRILIYGAGIQGSYLAHSLINGNNDVTLLARGKRKKKLITDGLVLHHSIQRRQTTDSVRVIETLQPADTYDLIFVTMKYSDFPLIIDQLAQNSSSTILFIGNQIDAVTLEKDLLEKSTQHKNIYFGFQMTGGTYTEQGTSVLRFGKDRMKIGSLHADFKLTQLLDNAFDGTNYSWKYEAKMDDWLKNHATMILVQNSFEYIHDFSPSIIRTADNLSTLSLSLKESFELLEASGSEILPKWQKFFFQHPALTKSFFSLYYRSPISQMVQGSFKEIYELLITFSRYQTKASPELDSLLQKAKEKYEKEQATLS